MATCALEVVSNGRLLLYIIIALYLFVSMTMLIHAHLISAILTFADELGVVSYSARNTMTTPGILLPEFFASFFSVFLRKGRLCSSLVIGSCAANSLLTLGIVGLLVGKPVKLSWYPLWRDNIFYAVAVTIILWTTYYRDHVTWQQCLFIFSTYVGLLGDDQLR